MREQEPGALVLRGGAAGPHVFLALIAGLLSAGLHVAVVLYLPKIELRVRRPVSRQVAPRPPEQSMRLGNVEREPQATVTRPAGLDSGDVSLNAEAMREMAAAAERPAEAALEPQAVRPRRLTTSAVKAMGPDRLPAHEAWQPRQDMLMIERQVVKDEVPLLERRQLDPVERVPDASDVVMPVWRDPRPYRSVASGSTDWQDAPERAVLAAAARGVPEAGDASFAEPVATERGVEPFVEQHDDVTDIKPVEALLKATVHTYETWRDLKYGYFRVEIERAGADILPATPKDIVLVQDCSSSVAEQRLYFCRQGLTQCLDLIAPEDRFNIVRFKESAELCFDGWAANDAANRDKARTFIENMVSGGNTDIFGSIRVLASLEKEPGRPIVALLVTDGQANTGLIRSTDIIGEFSKLNNGAVSVYTMGTLQTANSYLLDLLSYCNRAESELVSGGRWGIPETITSIMRRISRPVMSDILFLFSSGSGVEVYPSRPSNLYMDRPLILYGRYPRSADAFIFQALGRAGDVTCDMVFDIHLGHETRTKDPEIRENWARQKIYHLIGEFARSPSRATLEDMENTASSYRVSIPYRRQL
jgi:Mg-chelatase subunit ChlD